MSREDIILKIEKALSDILSDKYEAKVKIRFKRREINGNSNSSRGIREK